MVSEKISLGYFVVSGNKNAEVVIEGDCYRYFRILHNFIKCCHHK